MRKAYMVNDRIFFDSEKLSDYLLARVDHWKQMGCIGELNFPRVMLGTYSEQISPSGELGGIFTEKKSGNVYQHTAIS